MNEHNDSEKSLILTLPIFREVSIRLQRIILRRGEKKAPSPDPEDRLKGRKIRCEGVRDFIIGRLTVASSLRSRGL